MKKIFVLLFVSVYVFGFELAFNKKFVQEVAPDMLSLYVTVSIEQKDESYITNKIEYFNDYIKENTQIIKENGSFNLSPKYNYQSKKRNFLGYVGTLRYTIKSKSATDINQFIDEFIQIKDKLNLNNIKVNISNTTWIISQKLYNDNLDSLRLEAINWIEFYASNLTKQCQVKSININGTRSNQRMESNMIQSTKNYSNITPSESQKSIVINPSYILECR